MVRVGVRQTRVRQTVVRQIVAGGRGMGQGQGESRACVRTYHGHGMAWHGRCDGGAAADMIHTRTYIYGML